MSRGYVDVLIVTALQEELAAVLALGEGGEEGWKRTKDHGGALYHTRSFENVRGKPFVVAAAWAGQIGEEGIKQRTAQLIDELEPSTVAMCGICAGDPDYVELGDVIVADGVHSASVVEEYHHNAPPGLSDVYAKVEEWSQHDLGVAWRTHAVAIAKEVSLDPAIQAHRPVSYSAQERWLLEHIDNGRDDDGKALINHPERRARCPDWPFVIKLLRRSGLLRDDPGTLRLTKEGENRKLEQRILFPDGIPLDPPLRVHVGAIASMRNQLYGLHVLNALQARLPKQLAVDASSFSLALAAHDNGQTAVIVKAVSTMVDDPDDSDNRYRSFACYISAVYLVSMLGRLFIPEDRRSSHGPASRRDVFLEEISIHNFKSIHELNIDFTRPSELPGHWTCIAGLNGAGKSAVLQAIALVLLGERHATEVGTKWLARARRIENGTSLPAEISARVRVGQDNLDLVLPLDEKGVNETRLTDEPSYKDLRTFWNRRTDAHVLVAYGAGRNLSEYVDHRHNEKSEEVQRQMTLFDPLTQVASVDVLLSQGEQARPILLMLKRLIEDVFMKDDVNFGLENRDGKFHFRCSDTAVPVTELPDGFRATIAWLADICAAWHEKAPEEAKDGDPKKIRGTVLIDEIDLHLHASLQRVLVPRLRQALPLVQWIVTTHSPLVVASFDRREIVLLVNGEHGPERRELDRQIMGFSTDEVYEYLMGIQPRSAALEMDSKPEGARLAQILAQSPRVNEEEAKQTREWMNELSRRVRERGSSNDGENGSS